MLSNAYFLENFRFDTAENEPAKNLQKFARILLILLTLTPNPNPFQLSGGRAPRLAREQAAAGPRQRAPLDLDALRQVRRVLHHADAAEHYTETVRAIVSDTESDSDSDVADFVRAQRRADRDDMAF